MTDDLNKISKDLLEYIDARMELLKLHTAENISRIFSNALILAVISYLAFFILLLLTFAAGLFLGDKMDSNELGFLCVAGFYLLLLVIFIILRKQIVERAVRRAIVKLFFPKLDDDEKNT